MTHAKVTGENIRKHLDDCAEERGTDLARHLTEGHGVTIRPEHGISLADCLRMHDAAHPAAS